MRRAWGAWQWNRTTNLRSGGARAVAAAQLHPQRVPRCADAEDLLQEVFYELVAANRLLMPIELVTGWLYRVARNRIIDLFRKKKPENFSDAAVDDETATCCNWKICCHRPMPDPMHSTRVA